MECRTELEDLVIGAQTGNLRAFDTLVRRFQGYAVGYAATLLGDTDRAQDAAQDAFVELFHRLPTVRYPAAVPKLLRWLVHKHCDRAMRRSEPVKPLPETFALSTVSLESTVLREEMTAHLHGAVGSLPQSEREVVALYYLDDHSCGEVAEVLGVPVSTVKNRLHTARRRLRERMEPWMDETTPRTSAASTRTPFRDRVFAELFAEYRRQREQDPETADRSLLTRAHENLRQQINGTAPIDTETARIGRELLFSLGENSEAAQLMSRYLQGTGLSLSEEVWAQYYRLLALASEYSDTGIAAIVAEHPAFVLRVQEGATRGAIALKDSGNNSPVEAEAPDRMSNARLSLWALGPMEIANNYIGVDRLDDWIALADEVLSTTPPDSETRQRRCIVLYTMTTQLALCRRTEEALTTAARIRALAEEEPGDPRNPLWRIESESATMYTLNQTGGTADELRLSANRAIAEIDSWEAALSPEDTLQKEVSAQRHNIAFLLRRTGQYDLAAPLFEAAITKGQGTVWTYLWAAGAIWMRDGDTPETRATVLPLLKTAALRYSPNDFYEQFCKQKEFSAVTEDPELRAAVTQTAS